MEEERKIVEYTCAACGLALTDLIKVIVLRTVIFMGQQAKITICVACDLLIPINDLHWYPRKREA